MLSESERWVEEVLDDIVEEPSRRAAGLCELKIVLPRAALVVKRQVMRHMAKHNWDEGRQQEVIARYRELGDATELGWGFLTDIWRGRVG